MVSLSGSGAPHQLSAIQQLCPDVPAAASARSRCQIRNPHNQPVQNPIFRLTGGARPMADRNSQNGAALSSDQSRHKPVHMVEKRQLHKDIAINNFNPAATVRMIITQQAAGVRLWQTQMPGGGCRYPCAPHAHRQPYPVPDAYRAVQLPEPADQTGYSGHPHPEQRSARAACSRPVLSAADWPERR